MMLIRNSGGGSSSSSSSRSSEIDETSSHILIYILADALRCAERDYIEHISFRSKFCVPFADIIGIAQTVNSAHTNFWVITSWRLPTFLFSIVPNSRRQLLSKTNRVGHNGVSQVQCYCGTIICERFIFCNTINLVFFFSFICLLCKVILNYKFTFPSFMNLLKSTGHVMHQRFNIQQLYVLPTLRLYVLYLSENKQ